MRPLWRAAAPGSPKLLDGVASRLTLQKDARARSGIAEQMGLRVDATLSIPSLPATTGERGTFSGPSSVIPRSAATRDPGLDEPRLEVCRLRDPSLALGKTAHSNDPISPRVEAV
jgi:hypothetical protein